MSCHGCGHLLGVDVSGAFGQYVRVCYVDHEKPKEVDVREGCEKYEKFMTFDKQTFQEIEPDGQFKLF